MWAGGRHAICIGTRVSLQIAFAKKLSVAQMTLHGVWCATGLFSAMHASDLSVEAATETRQCGQCFSLARDVCGDSLTSVV